MEITVGSEGFVTTHNKQDLAGVTAWDFAFKEPHHLIHQGKNYRIAMARKAGTDDPWTPAWTVEDLGEK